MDGSGVVLESTGSISIYARFGKTQGAQQRGLSIMFCTTSQPDTRPDAKQPAAERLHDQPFISESGGFALPFARIRDVAARHMAQCQAACCRAVAWWPKARSLSHQGVLFCITGPARIFKLRRTRGPNDNSIVHHFHGAGGGCRLTFATQFALRMRVRRRIYHRAAKFGEAHFNNGPMRSPIPHVRVQSSRPRINTVGVSGICGGG